MYKVYIHKTETDGKIFYVGCGKSKNRPTSKNSRTKEWNDIVNNEGLIVEIVYETENKDVALFLESYLIQEHKRISDGGTLVNKAIFDNVTGVIRSDVTRQRMSEANKGKILSNETKRRMSEANKGKILSDETKQKMSKHILQYTKEGTFIREWKSGKEAGDTLNINKGGISQCCKGKLKTTGGFIWKYK